MLTFYVFGNIMLFLGYGTLLYRYHRGFRKALHQITNSQTELPSATVIVPARNEEANIARCLYSLLTQQFPGDLEILVVDDHSTDRTADIARSIGVRVIELAKAELPNTIAFKQKALQHQIKQSPVMYMRSCSFRKSIP